MKTLIYILAMFINSGLETVLSEARKFNLFLFVAKQYLKQLAGKTLDAPSETTTASFSLRTLQPL
jgi:hypothetical protein